MALAPTLHWRGRMRNGVWLVWVLGIAAAAGCQPAPCGGCADWETCDATTMACVLNEGARFDLVAADGEVPGDDWDPFFGPPDPFVCVAALDTTEQCTSPDSDAHSPRWNQTLLTDLDGAALQTATLAVRYEDSDLDTPDSVCSGTVTMRPEYVHDGGFVFRCGNGADARFELLNTARGTPAAGVVPAR